MTAPLVPESSDARTAELRTSATSKRPPPRPPLVGDATRTGRQSPPVGAPGNEGSLTFSTAEVKQLWWFFDGGIMNPSTRDHLWRARGFCSRHTWAHTVAEFELRVVPLGSAILFEDLLGRMVGVLRQHLSLHGRPYQLEAHDSCLTCEYLEISTTVGDPHFGERTAIVNRRELFTQALVDAEPHWRARSCPSCLDGQGPTCRLHLLQERGESTVGTHDLAAQLDELRGRLRRLVKSMAWNGPTASPAERASWVEALGWFAGWSYPDAAAHGAAAPTATDRDARWHA